MDDQWHLTDGDVSSHRLSDSSISHFLSGSFSSVLRERQRESVANKSSATELEISFLRTLLLNKPMTSSEIQFQQLTRAQNLYTILNERVKSNSRNRMGTEIDQFPGFKEICGFLLDPAKQQNGYLGNILFEEVISTERLNSFD